MAGSAGLLRELECESKFSAITATVTVHLVPEFPALLLVPAARQLRLRGVRPRPGLPRPRRGVDDHLLLTLPLLRAEVARQAPDLGGGQEQGHRHVLARVHLPGHSQWVLELEKVPSEGS